MSSVHGGQLVLMDGGVGRENGVRMEGRVRWVEG